MSDRLKQARIREPQPRPESAVACARLAREGATVFATDIDEKGLASAEGEGRAESPSSMRATPPLSPRWPACRQDRYFLNAAASCITAHPRLLRRGLGFFVRLNVKSMHRTIRAFLP